MPLQRRRPDRLRHRLQAYFRHEFRRELRGWWQLLRYYGWSVPLTLLALIAFLAYLDPLPPSKIVLGTGQRGSSYYLLSEKFADFFKSYGVEVELLPTQGLDEGLHALVDDEARVNASFITAGTSGQDPPAGMVSLGSLKYSPVWLFYRGAAPDPDHPLQDLLQRRMAIGMQGTNTRLFLNRMLKLQGTSLSPGPQRFEIPHEEAADRFARGQLDAVFIVDGIDSPTVQKLLKVPDRQIVEFKLAPAFVKRMPYLDLVTLPRGAIDLEHVYPPQDLTLLATSVTLVVESKTHPALQWLFLRAAASISRNRGDFFAKPGYFPKYVDQRVPLSPVGERYFSGGLPMVFDYLPNTLASLVEGTWGTLFAVMVVAWPLLMQLITWRQLPTETRMTVYWYTVHRLARDVHEARTAPELGWVLEQLDELETDMQAHWTETGKISDLFDLQATLSELREQARQTQQALNDPSSAGHSTDETH